MGRNATPKLGEWDGKQKFSFRYIDHDTSYVGNASDGKMIVFEREYGPPDKREKEVLATVYADGLQEVMAGMYFDGHGKGHQAGMLEARAEIRRALGVASHEDVKTLHASTQKAFDDLVVAMGGDRKKSVRGRRTPSREE